MDKINSFTDNYFFLSNFYYAKVYHDNKFYITNEHFFQAFKATTEEDHEEVRTSFKPGDAKSLGSRIKLIEGWEEMKQKVMFRGLLHKFTQHPELFFRLIKTGDAHLEEGNNHGDKYWGTVNGEGENHLGLLLMKVRTAIVL